jgi:hypothetical protein
LTLASIHTNRDKDGWKLSKQDWKAYLRDAKAKCTNSPDEFWELREAAMKTNHAVGTKGQKPPPPFSMVVPCLYLDLKAIESLLGAVTPAEVLVAEVLVRA